MNAICYSLLVVITLIAVAWRALPVPRASFQSQPGDLEKLFQPKPPPQPDPATRQAWQNSVHSLSNMVANLQALDDLLKASPLPEAEHDWVMVTVGHPLLQDDWMLLCHQDRRLDPEAICHVHAEISQALKSGQPVVPERVLFRNLRLTVPPRPVSHGSGKSRLELFYEARMKIKDAAGHRQVAEILRRHCPRLDLSRSGTLQEAWILVGLLEELREERQENLRWLTPVTQASSAAASNPPGPGQLPQRLPGDDGRLEALEQVYRRLFGLRFSRIPGLKDVETLLNELSKVSLGAERTCFWFIPYP